MNYETHSENESMTMTKKTLAGLICKELGYTKQQSAQLVESVMEIMKEALEQGGNILISGFGKFSVHEKHERVGWDPQKAEPMTLPARRVVKLKYSGKLEEELNRDNDCV